MKLVVTILMVSQENWDVGSGYSTYSQSHGKGLLCVTRVKKGYEHRDFISTLNSNKKRTGNTQ